MDWDILAVPDMYTLRAFVGFLLAARSWTGLHSPRLFSLFRDAVRATRDPGAKPSIESERKKLLGSRIPIIRTDHGAGSVMDNVSSTTVGRIAATALSNRHQCQFMAGLAAHVGAREILEFGTSLGISAAYLASASPDARVTTVEGDPAIARIARDVLDHLRMTNVDLRKSSFDVYLTTVEGGQPIDLLFLDGHHESKALLRYYNALLPRMHEDTVIIIDDIYWSEDMTLGWATLQALPDVTQSVDCFRFGLLFRNPDFLEKAHHRIRLPWRVYLG